MSNPQPTPAEARGTVPARDPLHASVAALPGGALELGEQERLAAGLEAPPQPEGPPQRTAAQNAALVDEVVRRTADPQFPYDPTAQWGDSSYREPRSDAESAARSAYLAEHEPVRPMRPPAMTALESQLVDAEVDAYHASMARDGTYPAAATRVRELEAALEERQADRHHAVPRAPEPGQQPRQQQTPPASTVGEFELSAVQREALTEELFERWRTAEPDRHHCFCGSDADLVDAVNHARQRADRDRDRERERERDRAARERAEQRQRDDDEIGS